MNKDNLTKYIIDIHHGLGDLIHMMPAIQAIRDANINNWIAVLVSKPFIADYLRSQNVADEIIILDGYKAIFRKKKATYDYGIIAPCVIKRKKAALMLRLMGAKKIIEEKEKYTAVHRVDRNNDLISSIGITIKNRYPTFSLPGTSKEYADGCVNKLDHEKKQ